MEKECTACNRGHRTYTKHKSPYGYCDDCVYEHTNRSKNPSKELTEEEQKRKLAEKRKYWDIWRKYKLSREDYDTMVKKQKGCCAICGRIPKRIMVDHNHVTGKVRGLLCGACNTAIGYFQDDPERIRKAVKYVKKYDIKLPGF